MNEEDAEPPQDGEEEEVLLQSAQEMFEKLRSLVSTKKDKLSKNLLSSIKKKIDLMYDDVNNLNDGDLPDNCVVQSVGHDSPVESVVTNAESTENTENHEHEASASGNLEETQIKPEPDACLVGSIKVKSLSLLLDPNRPKAPPALDVSSITISSDSDDDDVVLAKHAAKQPGSKSAANHVGEDNCASSMHSEEPVQSHSDRHIPDAVAAGASPSRKSILKGTPIKPSSAHKNVQFAKGDPAVHTYPYVPPVSSSSAASSSSSTESNSDEEFSAKLPKSKKKARTRVAHTRSTTKSVQFDEQIRTDKKFFSECVVRVQRIASAQIAHLIAKRCEDEIKTPETTRVDDMGGLKRKRGSRKDSSDSDQPALEEKKKKSKKHASKSSDDSDTANENENVANVSEPLNNGTPPTEEVDDNEAHSSNNHQNDVDNDDFSDNDDREPLFLEPETILRALSDSDTENKTATNSSSKKKSSSSSDSEPEKLPVKAKKKRTRAKRVLSDSDGSDSDTDAKSKAKSLYSDDSEEEKDTPKKKKRSRIKKVADSSDEEEKTTRKQLRKVISRDSLADTTKQAERDEAERKARIAERQEKYNNIFDPSKLENAKQTKVVLDFNEETQEELLSVDEALVKYLKPHQAKGIQFMWDACFESLERTKSTTGSGCILAHCMGLGKTLQVITLCHTLLKHTDKTGVKKILVVCPLSTVLNWVSEFKKWLPDDDEVDVYNLVSLKQNSSRAMHTLDWHRNGGVMVLGYDMFRNLSNESNKRVSKKMRNDFQKSLVDPGADMVVCDEGHLLKNEKTTLSKAMNRIKSLRRIVLTGTPLQNNLKEYYCMVQFVKPNLLGTYKEYLNRFVNPITNGQYTDSTQTDISIMRRRSHVLHKLLDGTVQRRDYCVLAPFLPPKHEYVIFVSLTNVQRSLYQHYLVNFAQRSSGARTSFLFTDFQELQRICTHPRVLLDKSIQNKAKAEKNWDDEEEEDSEGSLKDFIDDEPDTASSTGSSDESSGEGGSGGNTSAPVSRRRTRATADKFSEPEEEEVAPVEDEWWRQFTQTDELDNIVHSGKLALLFEILHQCELIGDKVLVFSQSLLSLNIIEYFLGKIDEASQNGDSSMLKGYASSWSLGLDYFRLDGSSSCDNRAAWCKTFNDPSNTRARLFLISTRAGGLGINLVAANRVIIFDVSWNPSHDIQSIYRVYRFGQLKPSYIYRFVTLGTMEMKVYERQVTKQAISKRVIDEQQIDRHYNQNDLQELYKFEPEPSDRPLPAPPKDILLGELLQNFTDVIFKYHEHQTLLENKEDEVLNEAERKAAWDEFENEKKMQRNTAGTINNIPMHTVVQALTSIIRREHPGVTQLEINGVMPQLVNQLREQLAAGEMAPFNKMLAEIRSIKAAEQARNQEFYKTQQQALWLAQQMQLQFPGLSTTEAERILRTQMSRMQQQQMTGGAGSQQRMDAPRILNPNEVVNLDED